MRNKNKLCQEYCTGCGLCHSLYDVPMVMNEQGFMEPAMHALTTEIMEHLEYICPCFGEQCKEMDSTHLWGRREGVYTAYASDAEVRYKASSGGVLTQLSIFLLEQKLVDGVLHIGKDPEDPIGFKMFCSTTAQEVREHCGSRYMSSAPLFEIKHFLQSGKRYAFIGKPCDVTAIRNWMKQTPEIEKQVVYLLSFFCAGAPSRNVNQLLLKKMGCEPENCVDLNYRGNGWPGYATATDINGEKFNLLYREAWGKTLGRDIRKICRFCLDGIGEMADISCGDAWYMDENKKPSFAENDGRNVVFCRTKKGMELFQQAYNEGYLKLQEYPECENDLQYIQYHQHFKRGSMLYSIQAMKCCLQRYPKYDKKLMKAFGKGISKRRLWSKFYGTVKRIINGKI